MSTHILACLSQSSSVCGLKLACSVELLKRLAHPLSKLVKNDVQTLVDPGGTKLPLVAKMIDQAGFSTSTFEFCPIRKKSAATQRGRRPVEG